MGWRLAVFSEAPGWVPSTHLRQLTTISNFSSWDLTASSGFCGHLCLHAHTQTQSCTESHTIHINKNQCVLTYICIWEAKLKGYFYNGKLMKEGKIHWDPWDGDPWTMPVAINLYFQFIFFLTSGMSFPETQLTLHRDGLNVFVLLSYLLLVHERGTLDVKSY